MAPQKSGRNILQTNGSSPRSTDQEAAAEKTRLKRLREDASQTPSINLAETIALSHQVIQVAEGSRHQ